MKTTRKRNSLNDLKNDPDLAPEFITAVAKELLLRASAEEASEIAQSKSLLTPGPAELTNRAVSREILPDNLGELKTVAATAAEAAERLVGPQAKELQTRCSALQRNLSTLENDGAQWHVAANELLKNSIWSSRVDAQDLKNRAAALEEQIRKMGLQPPPFPRWDENGVLTDPATWT
jgi:hypothetical protein